jgi:hypothetical protein
MSGPVSTNEIDSLITNSPFEASTVTRLEQFVRQQLAGQSPIHFEANQVLMKNYQIHCKLINIKLASQILVLALMRLPHTDYLTLSYMIPVTLATHPNMECLSTCAGCLEQGKFREFWIEYSKAPAGLFSSATGFIGSIRSFILHCLGNTFKNISTPIFLQLLGLPMDDIHAFISASPRALEVGA